MLPTKVEALRILESGYKKNPGQWKSHSIIVAKCAYKISSCCRNMNPEKAYILGLLHDIGRQEGVTYIAHVIDGYDFLMKSGYDEAAKICITHSFSIKNIFDYIGKKDITDDRFEKINTLLKNYEYDDYDRLIQLCDSIALPDHSTNIIKRMDDVKKRYGSYPANKWNKNIELEKYFEAMSGLDIDNINITLEDSKASIYKEN